MRHLLILGLMFLPFFTLAKEWRSLKAFQKETQLTTLQPHDWLKHDRKHNTAIWMNANKYNLENNKPEEYTTFKQRKDFFNWLNSELTQKGHDVVWPKMAYFICNKLRLLECFPYQLLTHSKMKDYAKAGSVAVFRNSFLELNALYQSTDSLKGEKAEVWDQRMLYNEQYIWIQPIYETMDGKSMKHIEKIAKGKSIYSLLVPKAIRFEGDISKASDRYNYALNKLYKYCKYRDL